jgi:hypothetical protein
MLKNIDGLCAERDRLKKEQPGPTKGKVLGGGDMRDGLKWYDHNGRQPALDQSFGRSSALNRSRFAYDIAASGTVRSL